MPFQFKPPCKPDDFAVRTEGSLPDFPDDDDEFPDAIPEAGSVPRGVPTPSIEAFGHVWDANRSNQLQLVVDELDLDKMLGLDFSVTLADPGIPDCPLIACSVGFSQLTRYGLEEIVGKNCRFLLQGVPDHLIDEDTRFKSRQFCISAADGYAEQEPGEEVPAALKADRPTLTMGEGEVLCVQTNARKSGEFFRNLFFMKTVDLDDRPFIIGLQAGLGEGYVDGGAESEQLQKACSEAFVHLSRNMGAIERMLASQFRYSGAMRRQC